MHQNTLLSRLIAAIGTVLCLTTAVAITGAQSNSEHTVTSPSGCEPGAVVEKISANSVAEKAGLKEGDVILSWTRGDVNGRIDSPFDIPLLEIEQAPLGSITLEGLRGNEKSTWVVGAGGWGVKFRPNFPTSLYALYQQGQNLAKTGKLTEAASEWRTVADQVDRSYPPWLHAWLLAHEGDIFAGGHRWKEATAGYEEAITQAALASTEVKEELLRSYADLFRQQRDWINAEKYYQEAAEEIQKFAPESLISAEVLDDMGLSAYESGDLTKAEKHYLQALEIQKRLASGSLGIARSLNGLGNIATDHRDLTKAEQDHRQALSIQEKLAPGSLDVAVSLYGLGSVAWGRGDFANAEEYFSKSLSTREELAPGSLDVAKSLNGLGLLAMNNGDLAKAEEYHLGALAIREELAPGSLDVAGSLNNLGIVAGLRGDLAKAEDYHLKALAIREKQAANSFLLAQSFNNLGLIAKNRGDLTRAEQYYLQSLAITEKQDAPGISAGTLNNLGVLASQSGDLDKAEKYFQRSLAIKEKLAPGSLDFSSTLGNLCGVEQARGDPAEAEKCYRRALAIKQKFAPGSVVVAEAFNVLANLLRDKGDLLQAEDTYRQARVIWEKAAPESKEYAEVLANLAAIKLNQGQPNAAAPLFEQALDALDGQIAHLGGTDEVRADFRAGYLSYYQNYIDLLIQKKQPNLAFQVLERGRARTFIETLTEAHIDVYKGADGTLLRQQRSLQADLAIKTNRRLRLLSNQKTEQVAALDREIEGLLARQKDVEEKLRAESPGYAHLTHPQPLSAEQAQQLLDQDTLLLAYSVGQERSYVFAVTSVSLEVYPLPKRAEIEAAARRAYQEELSVNNPAAGHESTAALSRMLLGPVAEHLAKKRIAIIADGALQYLPFAALRTPQGAWLIDEHEIVNLPSASTLEVLRNETATRKPAPGQVAVLADPVFNRNDPRVAGVPGDVPADAIANDRLERSVKESGLMSLDRLPATRREAEAIVGVAGKDSSLEALDFDASLETAISAELSRYRIVHFASHTLLNSRHPELSGIILSLVDHQGKPQDGFLQAHEIYNLKLNADLVVLSACETALGKEIRGEGLVGLTRAFMYAGAPRVVATLWRVPDSATAELMKQFYTGMIRQGLPPAAALRQAQVSLSREKQWSAPYYWAGFTLQGDWK
jgi:CHAT domain-containing protein/tetratricopeptide (TPR) repeat protein